MAENIGFFDDRFVIDNYSGLEYKKVLSNRNSSGAQWMAPDWMGEHRRRIQAYTMLAAYVNNSARMLQRVSTVEDFLSREDRREYGDPHLITEQARSSLLGDNQTVVVTGADRYDVDKPTVEAQAAVDRQDFLRQWGEDEQLITKVVETERNAVTSGDGVYLLGWDGETQRVFLRTFDPACYFPVLDDGDESKYPTRVHLAWQLPDEEMPAGIVRIRRITYDLRDVESYSVPWEDEPATRACYLTDATFDIKKGARSLDDLQPEQAMYTEDEMGEIRDRNLGIDFMPVIHIPNTVSIANHFGQSVLVSILQVLDDLQATDSDLQASAALTGSPMLALSGVTVADTMELSPRKAIGLGPDGKATMLSGAEGLTALANYRDDLLKRASVNARIPEAALGRIDPSKIEAGVILSLSFGPLGSLIDEMRLVRKDKYRLLFKFVQRFYLLQPAELGGIEGEVLDTDLVFGSFLPSDLTSTVTNVIALLQAKVISRETAMKMLQEVGVPIEDTAEEIDKINAADFEAATALLDATGNPEAVQDFLGGVKVVGPDPNAVGNPSQSSVQNNAPQENPANPPQSEK